MKPPGASIHLFAVAIWASASVVGASAQTDAVTIDTADPGRLAGVETVSVRATAVWDEEITTSAGGATQAQFEEALLTGFQAAIGDATAGPAYDAGGASFVHCHVDTFYDRGLIVYSVRVSQHEPGADGASVITWIDSWVGSYTAQQLHVIWTLSDQCAESYLGAWESANGGR